VRRTREILRAGRIHLRVLDTGKWSSNVKDQIRDTLVADIA
jgi:hypothetical protein